MFENVINTEEQADEGALKRSHRVFSGSSELAHRMSEFDWDNTPLGAAESWPQSLKTTVNIILNSRHPMWVGWGPEITFLYNDPYIDVLSRAKHPWALGRPASEVWAEIWDICGPIADRVFKNGEATFVNDIRLFMKRGELLEETYYSFSYSPILSESGEVAGLFCPSADITPKVLNERRLRTLSELAAKALVEKTTEAACASAAETLSNNGEDVPFALLYLVNPECTELKLEQAVGIPKELSRISPSIVRIGVRIGFPHDPQVLWPFDKMVKGMGSSVVSVLELAGLPLGPAGQRIDSAICLPIASSVTECPLGVLVAGVNPARKLDAPYRNFFEIVAGQLATAIQNARSVEQEKKRIEQLAEIDRAKTIFFSNVSHELRTPLTLMLGPLEDTLAESAVNDENHQRLSMVHRNGMRLLKLVSALLDFSRIEAGRAQASFEPTDLSSLTTELASVFRSAAEKAGLKLIVDCPPLSESVYVDRQMWEKIVLNLVSNAFKFTLRGHIHVSLHRQNQTIELKVEDTGVGIPEKELPRLFERFHRVEGAKGRTHEGTGIGLALVQELVRLHQGEIGVTSELGKGSTFFVALPLGYLHLPKDQIRFRSHFPPDSPSNVTSNSTLNSAGVNSFLEEAKRWIPESEATRPTVPNAAPVGGIFPARVLLADDNSDMRVYVERLLRNHWQIDSTSDGTLALEIAKKTRPDLILTDVMMPGRDGFALLRELRHDPKTREIPVIMLSARAGEEARIEGLEAGADDYLVKPFSSRELIARVQAMLTLDRVRKQSSKAIREGKDRLELALSAAKMIAWEWDLVNNFTHWSRSLEEFLGIEKGVAKSISDLVHPEDRGWLSERIAKAINDQQGYDVEFRIQLPGGGIKWLADKASFRKKEGENPKLIGIFLDVTDLKRAQNDLQAYAFELAESNAELARFAFVASHDLKEPLRSVSNYSQLLSLRYREKIDCDGQLFLKHITTGISRMYDLIDDLLRYSRVGATKPELKPVEVGEVVRLVIENLNTSIKEGQAEIVSGGLPTITADANQLIQLFQNLIGNAIKYRDSQRAPKILIGAERVEGHWLFSVKDNGIGIAPEHHEKVFVLFQRLHSKDDYAGSGIGLAVCKKIVDRHEGKIWLESGVGEGTTFFFTLPEREGRNV